MCDFSPQASSRKAGSATRGEEQKLASNLARSQAQHRQEEEEEEEDAEEETEEGAGLGDRKPRSARPALSHCAPAAARARPGEARERGAQAHLAPSTTGRARCRGGLNGPGRQEEPGRRTPAPGVLRPRPRRAGSAEGARSCRQRLSARLLAILGAQQAVIGLHPHFARSHARCDLGPGQPRRRL